MKKIIVLITSVVIVGIGAAIVAAAKAGAGDAAATAASQERWYKIPYFPDNQTHCSADLLPSICCSEAYVRASDVQSACQLTTTQLVRVVRDPLGVSSCCDCDHEFCVQITSSTPVVNELPSGACALIVLECYNSCSDCLDDL